MSDVLSQQSWSKKNFRNEFQFRFDMSLEDVRDFEKKMQEETNEKVFFL